MIKQKTFGRLKKHIIKIVSTGEPSDFVDSYKLIECIVCLKCQIASRNR